MSAWLIAAQAIAASALAWGAILAVARLDLARWVWLPAFRFFGALSVATTGLFLLGFPVQAWVPGALALTGLLAGVAYARLLVPQGGVS